MPRTRPSTRAAAVTTMYRGLSSGTPAYTVNANDKKKPKKIPEMAPRIGRPFALATVHSHHGLRSS
jgi:hypothetical protein